MVTKNTGTVLSGNVGHILYVNNSINDPYIYVRKLMFRANLHGVVDFPTASTYPSSLASRVCVLACPHVGEYTAAEKTLELWHTISNGVIL